MSISGWIRIWIIVLALFVSGCTKPQSQDPSQARLKTAVLTVGSHQLNVEIADTPETMERGLMFRKSLGENEGMLFVFPEPKQAVFWMRNTRIPLSVAYLDATGRILEIHDMFPYDETAVSSRSPLVAYALETNQGWFVGNKISPADKARGLPEK
ncbi:MAG: DUF192 domain-containing protein [Methylacidiphilales bacterium]|nr:DUF192 domain-containing protein [Candidatus Methylacidiphilales bacterium]